MAPQQRSWTFNVVMIKSKLKIWVVLQKKTKQKIQVESFFLLVRQIYMYVGLYFIIIKVQLAVAKIEVHFLEMHALCSKNQKVSKLSVQL